LATVIHERASDPFGEALRGLVVGLQKGREMRDARERLRMEEERLKMQKALHDLQMRKGEFDLLTEQEKMLWWDPWLEREERLSRIEEAEALTAERRARAKGGLTPSQRAQEARWKADFIAEAMKEMQPRPGMGGEPPPPDASVEELLRWYATLEPRPKEGAKTALGELKAAAELEYLRSLSPEALQAELVGMDPLRIAQQISAVSNAIDSAKGNLRMLGRQAPPEEVEEWNRRIELLENLLQYLRSELKGRLGRTGEGSAAGRRSAIEEAGSGIGLSKEEMEMIRAAAMGRGE